MRRIVALVFVVALLVPTLFVTGASALGNPGGPGNSQCKADPNGHAYGYFEHCRIAQPAE